MSTDKPSDEILNAFVDGEFCPEERLACLKKISGDEALSREVCDLCQVKEMVNLAYERVPAPPRRPVRARNVGGGWLGPVAAAVIMMLAVVSIVGMDVGVRPSSHQAADADQVLYGEKRFSSRILLHLTTADPERITEMLDEVELLMESAIRQGEALQIQVVANGEGLALMREDISPFPERVASLSARYAGGLRFTACLNTLERIGRGESVQVKLLPSVEMINSGVAEVVRRQSQGWAYIQV